MRQFGHFVGMHTSWMRSPLVEDVRYCGIGCVFAQIMVRGGLALGFMDVFFLALCVATIGACERPHFAAIPSALVFVCKLEGGTSFESFSH